MTFLEYLLRTPSVLRFIDGATLAQGQGVIELLNSRRIKSTGGSRFV